MIKIDNGVSIPGKAKFPWREMKPGDSFFAAGYTLARGSKKGGQTNLTCQPGKIAIPGSKWTVRTVTEDGVKGVRVWRTA